MFDGFDVIELQKLCKFALGGEIHSVCLGYNTVHVNDIKSSNIPLMANLWC